MRNFMSENARSCITKLSIKRLKIMSVTKTIQKTSRQVIETLRASISDKKARHERMMREIDPKMISKLRKMPKVEC